MVQTDGKDLRKSDNVIGEWFEDRDAEYKAHREKFVDILPGSVVGFVEKPSVDSFLEIGLSSLRHVPKRSEYRQNRLQKAPICSPENPLFPVVVPFRRLCKGKNPFQVRLSSKAWQGHQCCEIKCATRK